MDASDILDDLQILLPEAKPSAEAAARPLPPLSEDERRIYDAIEATETSIDEITEKTKLPSAAVSSTLLQLELKRLVKQLPGKYFCKAGIGIVLCGFPQARVPKNVSHLQKSCKWVRLPAPMSKSLIITEKPSVAGDIAKALGGFKKARITTRTRNISSRGRSATCLSSLYLLR